MEREKRNLLKTEAKELAEALENVNQSDKDIIIASLKGMLLVADVNKKIKEKTA